ncbi:UPF0146 family protein [Halopenitus sp. H-Gu1]|uniref:UPF0146 family protein n=1 Tax=Halopenitus sp. H-Gu1 TaxID=3242697 RepID=UPI00359EE61D
MTRSRSTAIANKLAELAAREPTGSAHVEQSPPTVQKAPIVLEIGIGRRSEVARVLVADGHRVVAIDVVDRSVPDAVAFARLDVHDLATSPSPLQALPIAADESSVAVVFGQNLPAELQPATARLAERLDAVAAFTTLGFEDPSPSLRVERRTVGPETLYVTDAPSR